MAIMHPASIIEAHHVYSEVKFYNACRDQLSDKFHVFYSVRWYAKNKEGLREDSECDFLIFHPDYGFLCIEVKGGRGIRIENNIWYLSEADGERELKRSPYLQAEQSMRFFKDYYETELESRYPGIYGNAVAFPNFCVNAPLSVDSPLVLTIDQSHMGNLCKRIMEIFQYFNGRRGSALFLSPESQKRFINIINKRIALSVAAGALIEEKERELLEINRTQDTVIDLLLHYKRAFIIGGAGTGKTWIAIKKVQRCVRNGGKALYLCYNRALAKYVTRILQDEAEVYNFDAFAYRLFGEKADEAPVENGVKSYTKLFESFKEEDKYDLIVVDEGQDFCEDWAYCVNLLLKEGGSLYVMRDENQNIFDRHFGEKFFIDNPPFVLRYNIRNTANIYKATQEKTCLGLDTIANQIEGVEPTQKVFTRKAQLISYIDSIINRLVNYEGVSLQKIVILSDRKKENSALADVTKIGGCPIGEADAPNVLAYRTIQGFKGLEEDVVIFLHHTYQNEPVTDSLRALLYTAWTRARYYLFALDYQNNSHL